MRLSTIGGGVEVSTGNGEVFAVTVPDGVSVTSPGECVCNFRVLRRLVGAAESGPLEITAEPDAQMLSVATHGAEALLVLMPRDAIAAPPSVTGMRRHLDVDAVAHIRRVLKAASQDPARPALGGVYFDEHGFVATDGHRLSFAPHASSGPGITIPRELLQAALPSLNSGCDMVSAGKTAALVSTPTRWVVPVLAVPFPRYQSLLHDTSEQFVAEIEVSLMLSILKRVSAVVADAGSVRLSAGSAGRIRLEASSADSGQIQEVSHAAGAWPSEVKFNVGYLSEAFETMDVDVARASFTSATSSLQLSGRSIRHVLMPQGK